MKNHKMTKTIARGRIRIEKELKEFNEGTSKSHGEKEARTIRHR